MTRFHTPPHNQGQIVEVSYALVGSSVIRWTFDASDRTSTYAISQALRDDDGDYWNRTPRNRRWRNLDKAEVQDLS